MRTLLLFTLTVVACTEPRVPEGKFTITGAAKTQAEHDNIRAQVESALECYRSLGLKPHRFVREVRVRSTCWIKVPGYSTPQRGTVYSSDVVIVGRAERALKHEVTIVAHGHDDHSREKDAEGNYKSPILRCEHYGVQPLPYQCEPKPVW